VADLVRNPQLVELIQGIFSCKMYIFLIGNTYLCGAKRNPSEKGAERIMER
jgi:hypothetical protein